MKLALFDAVACFREIDFGIKVRAAISVGLDNQHA
jgi:hypothetical protein